MFSKVKVHGLMLDPITEHPILLLRSEECGRILPIWIGSPEANAIALEIEKVHVPRPMTHDLLCHIIDSMGCCVRKVLISDLKENTYFAQVVLLKDEVETAVDSRPSDAVAIAMRTGAPIYIEDSVFERFAEAEESAHGGESQLERLLEKLPSEDMGEYKM